MTSVRESLSRFLLIGALLLAFESSAGEGVHWEYSGPAGSENWAELSEEFSICAQGRNQSPIDIAAAVDGELPTIELRYSGDTTEVVNNGHTIQVNVAPGSSLLAEGLESELIQFHFHSPSEHLIRGEQFALEAHFVHKSAGGDLSVLAVLFRAGPGESNLAPIWENLPATTGRSEPLELAGGSLGFIPRDLSYFRYNGSLTTPPCSEGVRWYVLQSSSTVSQAEVSTFLAASGENARPLRP